MPKPKYLDPDKILQQLSAKESNRNKLNALTEELWRVVEGPAGLANTIGEMLNSFPQQDRVGHQSQIRLVSDVVRLLERSADMEGDLSGADEEDLKAEFKRLLEDEPDD
jgi:hypothetical protein